MPTVGRILNGYVAKITVRILRETSDVNISDRVQPYFDGLVGAVGNPIIIVGNPRLLDLSCGGNRKKANADKPYDESASRKMLFAGGRTCR